MTNDERGNLPECHMLRSFWHLWICHSFVIRHSDFVIAAMLTQAALRLPRGMLRIFSMSMVVE